MLCYIMLSYFYICFDNDLMWQLEKSYMGICVHNINCGDDNLVLSLSKQGMDLMIAIW